MTEDHRKPPESAEELLRRYATGERSFSHAMLAGADLSSTDLNHADLSRADLSRADLTAANLQSVDLDRANLRDTVFLDADLSGADLRGANLGAANLSRANLDAANLHSADLSGADLSGADLSGANLTDAMLPGTKLRGAVLRHTNFNVMSFNDADLGGVHLGWTLLLDLDLSPLCDADPPAVHAGPSTVDFRTIVNSLGSPNLKTFLQRAGMPDVFVEYMVDCARTLDPLGVFKLLQSTFISHGGPDESFARKLYEALHRNGVTTFFFPEHAVPGKKIGRTMREGVNEYDRVILICSKNSLDRKGVLAEIEHALSREDRDGGASYVIPVVLDDYLFSGWAPANKDVLLVLKERIAADFRGADTDQAKFDAALLRLIGALKK